MAPGALVVIGLPNSPEHVFSALAVWKLGGCTLPLRWDLPAWERGRLLEIAKPAVALCDWEDAGPIRIETEALRATRDRTPVALPDCVPDPARAIASSGSTGLPKIIVKPGPAAAVPCAVRSPGLEEWPEGSVTELVPAPLYHTNGFFIAHYTLFNGDCAVLMERYEAERAVALIERYRVDSVTMVPTMLLRVAKLPDIDSRDLSSLAAVQQGGATIPHWLVRFWIDLVGAEHFHMSYGSTENVGRSKIRGDEWLLHPGSVGTGIDTDIRIVDEAGAELSRGEVGEIFMRSTVPDDPGFEYVGAPTPPRTDDGFVSIGDMGWLDEDGHLYIADRRVDMIVTGGANVFPAEVEAALLEHSGVIDAVVIGLPDDEWGQRVHAVVQAQRPEDPPSEASLRGHCKERLSPYKIPKVFEVVDRVPRSDAGKVKRQALVDERR